MWILVTSVAFALRHRKTTENLDRFGRLQDLPNLKNKCNLHYIQGSASCFTEYTAYLSYKGQSVTFADPPCCRELKDTALGCHPVACCSSEISCESMGCLKIWRKTHIDRHREQII